MAGGDDLAGVWSWEKRNTDNSQLLLLRSLAASQLGCFAAPLELRRTWRGSLTVPPGNYLAHSVARRRLSGKQVTPDSH